MRRYKSFLSSDLFIPKVIQKLAFGYTLPSLYGLMIPLIFVGIQFGKLQFLHAEETLFASDWETWTSAQIEEDFSEFSQGISIEMIDQTAARGYPYLIRYRVVDGKIYQSPRYHMVAGRLGMAAVRALDRMLKKFPVPDVDFMFYEADPPPFQNQRWFDVPGPILIGAKSNLDTNAILYHDNGSMCYIEDIHLAPYNLYPIYPPFMDAWDYDWPTISRSLLNDEFTPWEKRSNALFWRGRITDGQRAIRGIGMSSREFLVALSKSHSDLINANVYQYRDPTDHWSLADHLVYKYQIAVDGMSACFPGYIWRLFSNSLVFKQNSGVRLWFEGNLKPWVHYVPVDIDLTDLMDKIQWAMTHDAEAKSIAANARRYVLENAMPDHCLKYFYKVLVKYASLQRFKVKKPSREEMVLVSEPLTRDERRQRRRLLGK